MEVAVSGAPPLPSHTHTTTPTNDIEMWDIVNHSHMYVVLLSLLPIGKQIHFHKCIYLLHYILNFTGVLIYSSAVDVFPFHLATVYFLHFHSSCVGTILVYMRNGATEVTMNVSGQQRNPWLEFSESKRRSVNGLELKPEVPIDYGARYGNLSTIYVMTVSKGLYFSIRWVNS